MWEVDLKQAEFRLRYMKTKGSPGKLTLITLEAKSPVGVGTGSNLNRRARKI